MAGLAAPAVVSMVPPMVPPMVSPTADNPPSQYQYVTAGRPMHMHTDADAESVAVVPMVTAV